jgi:ABC-type glycerol-3-phosphate transport system permease component
MMAAGMIYALPPIVLLLVLRRHVTASLAMVSAGI